MRVDRWMTCIAGLLVVAACGGGNGNSSAPLAEPAPGAAGTSNIAGVVVASDSGLPLAGVTVQVATASVRTADDGRFGLNNVATGQSAVVRFGREGYVDTFVSAAAPAGKPANLVARMVPISASVSFDNAAGTTLVDGGSVARVVLPPSSVVDAATGKAPQGAVTMQLGVVDPASNSANMPGNYTTDGGAALESFGALSIQLRDAAGNKLALAAGRTATIRIPLSSRSAAPPPTVPLWYLSETTGKWIEEGTAALTGIAPKQFYEGSVARSGTWNSDRKLEVVFVNGCVVDTAGKPLGGAAMHSDGVDYSGADRVSSDASGKFKIAIRKGGQARIATDYPRTSDAVIVEPVVTDFALSSCIVASSTLALPSFVLQPLSVIAPAKTPVQFAVLMNNDATLTYQWFRNGQPISGATRSRLQLSAVTAADDQAQFTVRVTGVDGSVRSTPATLTVGPEISSDEAGKLISLLFQFDQFYGIALAPSDYFIASDGNTWLNPATVCSTGSASGSLNGRPIPAGSAVGAGNFNVTSVFNNCVAANSGDDIRSGKVDLNVTISADRNNLSAVSKVSNFTQVFNPTSDNRIDLTGNGTIRLKGEKLTGPSGSTARITLKPDADTTLRNNLTAQTARFIAGNVAITTTADSRDVEIQTTIEHTHNRFSLAGVTYESNGALTTKRSSLAGYNGSGQIALARNGYQVGRIFADDTGLHLENNGAITQLSRK